MSDILDVYGREVLDSRGNPTVEVEVVLEDGSFGRAMVPSGASTGAFEAYELRDGDKGRYLARVSRRPSSTSTTSALTPSWASMLSTSAPSMPRWSPRTVPPTRPISVPTPFWRVAGRCPRRCRVGGSFAVPVSGWRQRPPAAHTYDEHSQRRRACDNNVDFQEFMIMPVGAPSFAEGLRWCAEVYHTLKGVLHEAGLGGGVGDEGGFAPNLKTNADPFEYITKPWRRPALSPASTSCTPWTGLDRVLQRRDRHVRAQGRGRGVHERPDG